MLFPTLLVCLFIICLPFLSLNVLQINSLSSSIEVVITHPCRSPSNYPRLPWYGTSHAEGIGHVLDRGGGNSWCHSH